MSVLDAFKSKDEKKDPDPIVVPKSVDDRIKRGRDRMRRGAPLRNLCWRFWRGDQFTFINDKNVLQVQPTVTNVNGGGMPKHRIRQSVNLIKPAIEGKVSGATKRVPSYEVDPTSPEKAGAAELSEKAAVYGYDKWRIRRITEKVVTSALVAHEGFAWPYYDNSVGPFTFDGQKQVGRGEVKIRTYTRNQVTWEPGVEFDESPWWAVEVAMPVEEAKELDGYIAGELTPDAQTGDLPRSDQSADMSNLVLVTDYLERPCPKYPEGRWLTIANKRIISGVLNPQNGEGTIVRPYPLTDPKGAPLDEPVLHRLSYCVDPDKDEDMGLVKHLIDPQRSYNDAWCKVLEWKNRVLNPRIMAQAGTLKTRPDDTPGGVDYYVGQNPPQWQPTPAIPDSLFRIMEEAKQAIQLIAGTDDVPNQIEAAKAIDAWIEQNQARWQKFIANLAEWHSRLMRHCLTLMQKYYDEERTLEIRGRFGTETIEGFKGADLMSQINVRVYPSSIEPLTKQGVQDRIQFLVQNFPGQISLEEAMAAIKGGTAESLVESFLQDVGRAERMIQKIKAGPDFFLNAPMRLDSLTGQEIPSWMPRKQDNLGVHLHVFGDYMKTDEFDRLDMPIQEAINLYYDGCEQLQQQKQMQQAAQQEAQAQGLGMANASAPQGPPPLPNQPQGASA